MNKVIRKEKKLNLDKRRKKNVIRQNTDKIKFT